MPMSRSTESCASPLTPGMGRTSTTPVARAALRPSSMGRPGPSSWSLTIVIPASRGTDTSTEEGERVAGHLLVQMPPPVAAAQVQGGQGERSPVAEVAVATVGIDEGDQLLVDAGVERVVAADHADDLAGAQGRERHPAENPGPQHGFTRQYLPATVPADQQRGAPAPVVLAQMAQELDALPVEVLRLVDHDEAGAQHQLHLEQPRQLEPVALGVAPGERREQVAGDEPHGG